MVLEDCAEKSSLLKQSMVPSQGDSRKNAPVSHLPPEGSPPSSQVTPCRSEADTKSGGANHVPLPLRIPPPVKRLSRQTRPMAKRHACNASPLILPDSPRKGTNSRLRTERVAG